MEKKRFWLLGIAAFIALSMVTVTGCFLEAPVDEEVLSGAQGVSARSATLLNALSTLDGTNWNGYTQQNQPPLPKATLAFLGSIGVNGETGTVSCWFPYDNSYPVYNYTFDASNQDGYLTENSAGGGNPGYYYVDEDENGNYSLVFPNFYGYHPASFDLVP
jgi:hypothetical protein